MKTKAIFSGGPLDKIEQDLEGQPTEYKERETLENHDGIEKYRIHLYIRSEGDFKESQLVPYSYRGIA